LGATLFASPLNTARADSTAPAPIQQPQTTVPQAEPQATEPQPETVEQRITNLHVALKITPDQEKAWDSVAQAMRENAAAMETLVAERTVHAPKNVTAVQDLQSYEKFTQEHANALKKLIPSFEALYNSMPDEQKKVTDEVFQSFGHRNDPSHT
jgi:hypothetical protein